MGDFSLAVKEGVWNRVESKVKIEENDMVSADLRIKINNAFDCEWKRKIDEANHEFCNN